MDYQQVYPDDRSYHSSKEGDYAHDSPNYYLVLALVIVI